jgi:DNA-binding transcriptional regulator YhcF (GntR family)
MLIALDPSSPLPPFEQIRAQISESARTGVLPTGMKLPSVRKLAESLGLAANTVARAYRELEADGVVETRGRGGTVIAAAGDAVQQAAEEAAAGYVDRVKRLGLSRDEALRTVDGALRAAYGA